MICALPVRASFDTAAGPVIPRLNFDEEAERIIQMQRTEIQRLRQEIQGQSQVLTLRPPTSGTKLPALAT